MRDTNGAVEVRSGHTTRGARLALLVVTMCCGSRGWGQCDPSWAHPLPVPSPSVRTYHGMVYDPARERVLLFGGTNRTTLRSDTWEWNGSAWTLLDSVGTAGGRRAMAMSFHSATNTALLFGGISSLGVVAGTWQWNGTAWSQLTGFEPGPRADSAMVYDAARERSVLFGGWGGSLTYFGDTWEWNGSGWSQLATAPGATPHARAFHAMAYDSARGRTVLFGGLFNSTSSSDYYGDTWEWDGMAWTQMAPATSPPARAYHAMAFDAATRRVVLFGGFEFSAGTLNDTWAWDGVNWTRLATASAPSVRTGAGMAYDAARSNNVLFGGQLSATYFADTWTLTVPQCCPADFNNDGGVDGDDVIAFFGAWDAALIAADFNGDGGVDGDDVIGFFGAWDAGC